MSLEDRMLKRPRREAVADQLDPGRAAGELGLQATDRFAAKGIDEAVERPERLLAVAPDITSHRTVGFDADDPEVAVERDALGEQAAEDRRARRGAEEAADRPLGRDDLNLLAAYSWLNLGINLKWLAPGRLCAERFA